MSEQPIEQKTALLSRQKNVQTILQRYGIFIRLIVAFLCGVVFAFVVNTVMPIWSASSSPFVPLARSLIQPFPFYLGMLATFTVPIRRKYIIVTGMLTGLFAWVGMAVYWLLVTAQVYEVNGACPHNCHPEIMFVYFLIFYLIYGVVAVIIGSAVTGFVIKLLRRGIHKDIG